jgi:hypothetical protein
MKLKMNRQKQKKLVKQASTGSLPSSGKKASPGKRDDSENRD